ncbi:MAG: hypothetical protein FJW30_10445 [Acidobacteria bacterium]|nr:hypothetical protein [Acidobacteriota bacterium]
MSEPLPIGIAGLGRMGWVHARHLLELERIDGVCRLAAIVDADPAKTARFAAELGFNGAVFHDIGAYAEARVASATMVVTPTEKHREHTVRLVEAGHRVLLEKPLTGSLTGDAAFAAELDAKAPKAVMLAFQRRFDAALAYGRKLALDGAIGKVFKIYSALEDSGPAPNGYQSDGILPDMSVHNVDEILWITGRMPEQALAIGSRVYSHALTTCQEDFDDAMLYLWFGAGLTAQVQVTRNHVSGYRVETIVYGDQGQVQIGRFDQRPGEIVVEAFGRRGRSEPIARQTFPGGDGGPGAPEFVDRFGPAYKAEAAVFIERCRSGGDFPTNHNDGLRAQRVISSGMRAMLTVSNAATVE